MHSGKQLNEPRYSQSLETGLLVMKGFSSEHPVQGIAEVADRLEASRSTVHRYMTTLVALGMLEQHPRTRRYRVALLPVDLGRAALDANRVVSATGDALQKLRRQTGCTARTATTLGFDSVILDSVRSFAPGQGLLGVQLRRGAAVPGHASALGKASLSALDPKQLKEALASAKLAKFTGKTSTSKRAIETEIAEVRANGYAIEEEEHELGVVGIAVPINDSRDAPAGAIGLVAHTPEITLKTLRSHLADLQAAAAKIGDGVEPAEPKRRQRRDVVA